jgi:hypothetical protein
MGWVDSFPAAEELSNYVERDAIPSLFTENNPAELWRNIRPLCLNMWLSKRNSIE